jgi:hypothetical protein
MTVNDTGFVIRFGIFWKVVLSLEGYNAKNVIHHELIYWEPFTFERLFVPGFGGERLPFEFPDD